GPGLTNAITAMAQARADSIPMLVISGVSNAEHRGEELGQLHELPDQAGMMRTIALSSETLDKASDIEVVLDRAFRAMTVARPGPVHIEIPLNLMAELIDVPNLAVKTLSPTIKPTDLALEEAAQRCRDAQQVVIIAGGGAIDADIRPLAERLDAPVVTTINARGIIANHPLSVPASPSEKPVRDLLAAADLVIAVGTQFGPTDFDMYVDGKFPVLQHLIRIDIDAAQTTKGQTADQVIVADAKETIQGLTRLLGDDKAQSNGAERANRARQDTFDNLPELYRASVGILKTISDTLPGCVMVGDSTQLIYAGNSYCEINQPRGWFNSATGYGALGYGAPAAIGAKIANSDVPVVCLTGDGGFQFCLAELGTAMDENTPVIFIVWNNNGYQEIETYMVDNQISPIGVKPSAPDFVMLAKSYGMQGECITNTKDIHADLVTALTRGHESMKPYLIEIQTS
ncbi:MAG: 5-guanidino-2-oxopentanoate decarboxylase, partial [Alphaproteobacteria bacterium]